MQRDMDLIRELLLRLEAIPIRAGGVVHITPDVDELSVPGKSADEIDYHLSLIEKAGLIDNGGMEPMVGIGFRALTWAGHDFLDSVRDPAIWRDTKEGARRAGGFSVELLTALAKGFIKKKIEQHTGINVDI
jgi:Hypothetical protein (DUF2513)